MIDARAVVDGRHPRHTVAEDARHLLGAQIIRSGKAISLIPLRSGNGVRMLRFHRGLFARNAAKLMRWIGITAILIQGTTTQATSPGSVVTAMRSKMVEWHGWWASMRRVGKVRSL